MVAEMGTEALTWLSANVEEESQELRQIAARYFRDPAMLDDLVQATIANAWGFLVRGGVVTNPRGWLRTLLFNEIYRAWRKGRRWKSLSTEAAELLPDAEDFASDYDRFEVRSRHLEKLRSVFQRDAQDPGLRVLQLRLEDKSFERIARIVNSSPTACRVKASRARARLRRELVEMSAATTD